MIQKVLIANRGEIALRIVRACRELGIKTLAVYSEADVQSLHVQLADEAICIGGPKSSDSYLRADRIMSAAEIADVDAIADHIGLFADDARRIAPTVTAALRLPRDRERRQDQRRLVGGLDYLLAPFKLAFGLAEASVEKKRTGADA